MNTGPGADHHEPTSVSRGECWCEGGLERKRRGNSHTEFSVAKEWEECLWGDTSELHNQEHGELSSNDLKHCGKGDQHTREGYDQAVA